MTRHLSIRRFSGRGDGGAWLALALLLVLGVSPPMPGQTSPTSVLTYHNDNTRSGANLTETILTYSNVNSSSFGKLWFFPADGWVDAQPLYVSNLSVTGQGTHNVLFVATENDSLYAIDAVSGALLWQKSLLLAGETPSDSRNCAQISPVMGITSTPVISLDNGGTLFAVAMSKDASGNYHQRLHAISLAGGLEQLGGPVNIQATYPSVGPQSSGGVVAFNPAQYKARPALLLSNGVLYVSFSSNCDTPPYSGWVMAYDSTTLAQVSVLNVTPNGNDGALWGAGGGPATDSSGNIYVMVGNGTFDPMLNAAGFPVQGDFGNGFLKLSLANNTLSVTDYFASFNAADGPFDENVELGSSSPVVLPDMTDANGQVHHLAIGAGKPGTIFVVDRDNMGQFNASGNDSNAYQALPQVLGPGGDQNAQGALRFPPVYFNNTVYFGANLDPIMAFQFTNASLGTSPVSSTTATFQYPGAGLSISANGAANGILWAVTGSASSNGLHAYNAGSLTTELYNSNLAPNGRDQIKYVKFAPPTVANGAVYVATQTGIAAFGLFAVTLACTANAGTAGVPFSSTLAVAGGVPPYTFSITAGALPAGLTLNTSTGAVTGTPTAAAYLSYTAQVMDSTGTPRGDATANCSITIASASGPVQTSTTLSVTPNPSLLGQAVTLTSQTSPSPGSGDVTFYDDVAVLGISAVSGGSASLTTSLLSTGAHQLSALYGGNADFASSVSAVTALTVQANLSSTFLAAVGYPANGPGSAVAIGDFNGDGNTDFVVANSGVSVFLGNGNGTFGTPRNSGSGPGPIALVTGDFNGDGLLDLATVGPASGISILMGNGDGTFQAAVNYAAGASPSAVATGDWNGDGVLDLAVAGAPGVSVLLGNVDGTFQTAVTYAAGSGPASVATGDLNGDGKADLAVANAADGTVSVLLGNGDGTFQAAVSYAVAADPQSVAIGDLNGDGKPDMVTANNGANSVSVLLGNGGGTFQGAVNYGAGSSPQFVAVSDINGNGKPDVLVANASGGSLSVLLGNGDGSLQTAVSFGGLGGPVSLAVANFNGDGLADVVVTGGVGSTASVLLGAEASTTVALSSSQNPSGAGQLVAFTGAVMPTVPFFGTPTGTLSFTNNGLALPNGTVALSGGSAQYSASLSVGTYPIAASYSGDAAFLTGASSVLTEIVNLIAQTITFAPIPNQIYGSPPFAVTATASSGLPVTFTAVGQCAVTGSMVTLTGVGSCTISASQSGSAIYAPATTVGQSFNISPGSENLTLTVPPGPVLAGQAVTLSAQLTPAPGSAARAVFYDSATIVGFAQFVSGRASYTTTLLGPGTHALQALFPGNANMARAVSIVQSMVVTAAPSATFGGALTASVGVSPSSVAVGDFNHDGYPDIAVPDYDPTSGSTDSISVLLNTGVGTFATAQNYKADAGTTAVAIGDFNGDGISDLAVVSTAGRMRVLEGNSNGTFTVGAQHFAVGTDPVRLAVADFNGDGNADVAVVNKGSNSVSVLLGNGNLTFQNAVNYAAGTSPFAILAGDFNGDGVADLAVSNAGSNSVTILLGNGAGTFQPGVTYAVGTSPAFLAIGDFNGDQNQDLAVVNTGSNNVSVLLGNGDGTFRAAVNYAGGKAPFGIAATDLNGDGILDLAIGTRANDTMVVLLGNGDGTFRGAAAFPLPSKPAGLAAMDFNGDGRSDIVMANSSASSVSVLLAVTAATSTTLASSPNPSKAGQTVTFKAVVHSQNTANFATPTGTVTFNDSGTPLPGGTVVLNGTFPTFSISTLSPGAHSITAVYSGDARFGGSTSSVVNQTIK